jgi:hypothetical protein
MTERMKRRDFTISSVIALLWDTDAVCGETQWVINPAIFTDRARNNSRVRADVTDPA